MTETRDLDFPAGEMLREATRQAAELTSAEAQEAEANAGHYLTASLCGKPVRIVPPGAWRMSWQRKLRAGDLDAFAECVISPDDFELYEDLDPTNDEFGQFLADAGEISGESLGKSSGPRASSKNMRRR